MRLNNGQLACSIYAIVLIADDGNRNRQLVDALRDDLRERFFCLESLGRAKVMESYSIIIQLIVLGS